MFKHFKCPNKIDSSARIEGYFADLKSTVIDKRKTRLRLYKLVVTHLRAIRGSMKIAKSVTITNEFRFNEGDDNGKTIKLSGINNAIIRNQVITNIITDDSKEEDVQINANALEKIKSGSESKMINSINNKISKYNALKLESDEIETGDDDLIWKPKIKNPITDTMDESGKEEDTLKFNVIK